MALKNSVRGGLVLFFVLAIQISLPQCVQGSSISRRSENSDTASSVHHWADDNATDLFEGDIIRWPQITLDASSTEQEAARIAEKYHWPNGVVPLRISDEFDEKSREFIINVTKEFEVFTCIRFPYHQTETDFVQIVKTPPYAPCRSDVGRQGGSQKVHLNYECSINRNDILHELMHTLGFFHEQSRPDRDEYVKIIWDNMYENKRKNFKKQNPNNVTFTYTPYDFSSVMHYPKNASSRNGRDTMRPLIRNAVITARGLSPLDKHKVNCVYKCPHYENCEHYIGNDQHEEGNGVHCECTTQSAASHEIQHTSSPNDPNNCQYQYIADTKPQYILSHNNYSTMNYPPNLNCSWTIRGKYGNEVGLVFETFNVQYSEDCSKDFVKLYNTIPSPDTDKPQWGPFCGERRDSIFPYGWSDVLRIHFRTDGSVGHKGFKLFYYSVPIPGDISACGSTLNASETVKYFDSHAPWAYEFMNHWVCNWTVTATSGKQLVVVVNYLEATTNDCRNDYMELYNGANLMGAKIGRFCANKANTRSFRIPNGRFSIYSRSDYEDPRFSFKIIYFEE